MKAAVGPRSPYAASAFVAFAAETAASLLLQNLAIAETVAISAVMHQRGVENFMKSSRQVTLFRRGPSEEVGENQNLCRMMDSSECP